MTTTRSKLTPAQQQAKEIVDTIYENNLRGDSLAFRNATQTSVAICDIILSKVVAQIKTDSLNASLNKSTLKSHWECVKKEIENYKQTEI